MARPLDNVAYLFGAVTAGGGFIGFAKTGSIPSLVAGGTVGALYAYGGYRIQNREPYGVEAALLASLVLAGSSWPRAFRLRKTVPMLLSVLATAGVFLYGKATIKARA